MHVSPTAAWLLAASLLAPGAAAAAQEKQKKGESAPDLPKNAATVALQTEDGVILTATYWKPKPASRTAKEGSKQTGVVIIPNVRGHTQRESYPFAAELSDAGVAVVTFDFRGGGQSTQTVAGVAARKSDGGLIRAEDVLRNAQTIDRLTLDFDAVKQFLLRENNAETLNIRQSAILAVGDLASTVALNWIATREFGQRQHDYTREGGDLAALCLVNPAIQFKGYKAPLRLGEAGDRLPIYIVSTAAKGPAVDASEKLSRMLRLPDLAAKKGGDDKKSRPGGWSKAAAKKGAKAAPAEVGVELFRGPETADLRRGILGFLVERTKYRREVAWEGGRDVDQSFKVISRSDQE